MSALESTLTAFLMKATLLLVAVLAAHLVLRRYSAATRHLVLTLAMCGLVALPLLALSLPVWQLEVLPPAPTKALSSATAPLAAENDWELSQTSAAQSVSALPVATPTPQPKISAVKTAQPILVPALLASWILGSAFVVARLLTGLLRLRGIVRNGKQVTDPTILRRLDECTALLGLETRPRLVASDRVEVPLVWGWFRPLMVVPAEFTRWHDDRVRAVMLHELGHLKRRDWPVLVLGRVVSACYWFHPLVWCLERCARRECERACDDLVVTCGTRPSDYAGHLLSIARGVMGKPAGIVAALAVVRRSQLKSRLCSILDPVLRRNAPSRAVATGLGTGLLLVLLPMASLQFAEQALADEPQESSGILLAQHSQKMRVDHESAPEKTQEAAKLSKQAYALHKQGRYEEAIDRFQEALDRGFNPGPTLYNIACCHALLGEADAAMSWLEKAIDAGFDDPRSLVKDGDFDPIRSDRRFQSFIDEAFRAAGMQRVDPKHYPYRAALAKFDESKESQSTDAKLWAKLGTRLLTFRELDRSIEAYHRALELSDGQETTVMYNLACAYSLAGRTAAGLDWLERSVDAGFDSQERFKNDTDLDSLRGNPEFDRIAAKNEFLSLSRFSDGHRGDSDYSPRRWAPAVAEFEKFVDENPSNGRGWFNLGYALHGSRSFDEAIGAFQKAAELGYHPQTAIFNIACGNAMLGQTDAALDALEQAAASGGLHYGQLMSDSDLDSLREEPRFQTLLEQLEEQKGQYELKMQKKKLKEHLMQLEMKKTKKEKYEVQT